MASSDNALHVREAGSVRLRGCAVTLMEACVGGFSFPFSENPPLLSEQTIDRTSFVGKED